MYADPAHIRKHHVKVSLSDHEARLLEALADYSGQQKATLVREILVQRALEVLHVEGDSGQTSSQLRGLNKAEKVA